MAAVLELQRKYFGIGIADDAGRGEIRSAGSHGEALPCDTE
jgi:hypothetical protein